MKIKEMKQKAIQSLKGKIEEPNRKIRMLLSSVLKEDKEWILLHEENEFPISKQQEWEESIRKLEQGMPIQYITHYQEFMKLGFYVDENVLIPQPDTEILVEEVIKLGKEKENLEILDFCTGSGCIAVALAKYLPLAKVDASDISDKAIEIAKKNAQANGVNISWKQSDLWEQWGTKTWDLMVANPPYIKTEVIHHLSQEVRKEPLIALDGGEDGLVLYKKIIGQAYQHLKEKGWLCLEIGYDQKEEVMELLEQEGKYKNIKCIQDLAGLDRVIMAQKS